MDNFKKYKKLDPEEIFTKGDLVALESVTNKITRADYRFNNVIGIYYSTDDSDLVTVQQRGIIDVNVTGVICAGDKLTISNKKGKACAIKYDHQEEKQFNIRAIGKVIGIYNTYSVAKVLLDIE